MAETTDRHAFSLWKRALFSALMLALVIAVVEVTSWVAGSIVFGNRFSRTGLQARRDALVESHGRVATKPRWIRDEMLHPYLGFLQVPSATDGPFGNPRPAGNAGSPGADSQLVVAVVGGSFAHQFAEEGLPHLLARLGELAAFRGKTLVSLNAAAGGYKQPQQLMAVAYLLALGVRIDILVNLDGFNEVALHPTENLPAGVFPAYPRRWHQRVEGVLSTEALRTMLERAGLEDRRTGLARTFSRLPWRSLNTADLIYLVLDAHVERRLVETDRKLLSVERQANAPIVATGPRIEFKNDLEMFAYLVDLWRRSSRALHDIVAGQGIRYYHFLQPNQYVPASKPMAPEETRDALRPGHAYQRIVKTAYPLLRESGRTLAAQGVRFQDLSAAFAAHPEPLYIDTCCHVNRRGNIIVADHIFDAISRDLSAGGASAVRPGRPPGGSSP